MSHRTQDITSFLLAPEQERLFLLPEGVPATQAVAFLADPVSETDLRSALEQVVSRHEILRTTFVRVAGMRVPQQAIRDALPPAWTSSVLPADDRLDPFLDSLLREEAAAPHTEQGPILRAAPPTASRSDRALV